MEKKSMTETQKLVIAAMCVALSVILSRILGIYVLGGTKRISFASIPIFIGSLYLGAGYGALIGAVTDITGSLLFPIGGFNILFTIAPAISGALPGLIMKKNYSNFPVKIVFICVLQSITVAVINSYLMSVLYGKNTFLGHLLLRIPFSGIMILVKSLVLIPMVYRLKSFMLSGTFKIRR